MYPETIQQILELNRQFYQNLAEQFSNTRQRLQPGVQKILHIIPTEARILDLGCGNGALWRSLHHNGFQGEYIGIDFSSDLLRLASLQQPTTPFDSSNATVHLAEHLGSLPKRCNPLFIQQDLSQDDWDSSITGKDYNFILAFSVLHHIPSKELRLKIIKKIHKLLTPSGRFIHSEWQFLDSERLRARIKPWESIGLSNDLVDFNDFLLDWQHGGYGLRYVHHFSEDELSDLANESRFRIIESFRSDGQGGKLGLYQVWAIV